MKIIVNDVVIALSAETDSEQIALQSIAGRVGRVFELMSKNPGECRWIDLGAKEFACREPINIFWTDTQLSEQWRLVSNLAPTPFELDGRRYESVESFWQGLKFEDPRERHRIAALDGPSAMMAGRAAPTVEHFTYAGYPYESGRPEHWALMRRACQEKFRQNAEAGEALLSTGDRVLTHKVKRDSRTIPGAVLADMWMSIRQKLRKSPRMPTK